MQPQQQRPRSPHDEERGAPEHRPGLYRSGGRARERGKRPRIGDSQVRTVRPPTKKGPEKGTAAVNTAAAGTNGANTAHGCPPRDTPLGQKGGQRKGAGTVAVRNAIAHRLGRHTLTFRTPGSSNSVDCLCIQNGVQLYPRDASSITLTPLPTGGRLHTKETHAQCVADWGGVSRQKSHPTIHRAPQAKGGAWAWGLPTPVPHIVRACPQVWQVAFARHETYGAPDPERSLIHFGTFVVRSNQDQKWTLTLGGYCLSMGAM